MFKKALLFALALFVGMAATAQPKNGQKKFSPKKFRSEMEAFIVREACLTPAESAAFFPLYDEMYKKQRVVFDSMRRVDNSNPTSDEDCRKAIKERDKLDLELKEIQQAYHNKFMRVLPAAKVFKVLKAEDRFHRRMLKRDWNNRKK